MTPDLGLLGKDYFTREEAARYACVSVSHWDNISRLHNIPVIPWAGKRVYRTRTAICTTSILIDVNKDVPP